MTTKTGTKIQKPTLFHRKDAETQRKDILSWVFRPLFNLASLRLCGKKKFKMASMFINLCLAGRLGWTLSASKGFALEVSE